MSGLWLVVLWVAALAGGLALALRSGDAYTIHDAEEHATEYAGVIKEAHGPVTAFLWVCYAAAAIFTVVYTIVRWADLREMFHAMGM